MNNTSKIILIVWLLAATVLLYVHHGRINRCEKIQRAVVGATFANKCNGDAACTKVLLDKFYELSDK